MTLRQKIRRLLIEDKHPQGDILNALSAETLCEEHDKYVEFARGAYCNDECEIDDHPLVSHSDDGCWVSAWVWVSNADVEDE